MATLGERIQAAWDTGDPLALHREVEKLAAEGQSRQALEDALEALLLAVRTAGAGDETEEVINGVWDRLTGWCHASRHIETQPRLEKGTGVESPIIDSPINGTVKMHQTSKHSQGEDWSTAGREPRPGV